MYLGDTGSTGLHRCVWQVVDNAVDEVASGYATTIEVVLRADGGCSVVDDGRGIPTEPDPDHGMSGVEIAFTRLHSGPLPDLAVVTALSRRLVVEVHRLGKGFVMEFSEGEPVGPPQITAAPTPRTGTSVTFWPDPKVFDPVEFSQVRVVNGLRERALRAPGAAIQFRDERPGQTHELSIGPSRRPQQG